MLLETLVLFSVTYFCAQSVYFCLVCILLPTFERKAIIYLYFYFIFITIILIFIKANGEIREHVYGLGSY